MCKKIIEYIKNNIFYILALILISALLGLYFYKFHGELSSESQEWDAFGSYVGGVFSALAFIMLIIQMQIERKRFSEQKQEFEQEKKEQEDRIKKENFELTFFRLLEQHNTKLFKIEGSGDGNSIVDEIYRDIVEFDFSKGVYRLRTIFEYGNKKEKYSDVNVYFLNLYRIMRFIDNSDVSNKKEYFGILRSFLSKKILLILAFHLSKRDPSYEKYVGFIDDYGFLEHLDLISLEVLFLKNIGATLEGEVIYEKIYKACNYNDPNYVNVALDDIYICGEDFDINDDGDAISFKNSEVESNYSLLSEMMLGKIQKKEIFLHYIDVEIIDKNKVSALLFEILNTFKSSAFGKNLGYTNSHLIYKEFINYASYKDSL